MLLAMNRPDEALTAFEQSDDNWPGRYNTLLGAVHAAEAAGDPDAATDWAERLLEIAPEAERDSTDLVKTLAQRD